MKMKVKKLLSDHWNDLEKMPNDRMNTWQCTWCKQKRKHHSTRMMEHPTLAKQCVHCPENVASYCKNLLANQAKKSKPNERARTESAESLSSCDESDDDSVTSISSSTSDLSQASHNSERIPSRSTTLDRFCDKITLKDQTHAGHLFALAIFASGSPLSLFDNAHWQEFLRFLRPKFNCPSRHTISNTLLQNIYNAIKNEVEKRITTAPTVNIQTDG